MSSLVNLLRRNGNLHMSAIPGRIGKPPGGGKLKATILKNGHLFRIVNNLHVELLPGASMACTTSSNGPIRSEHGNFEQMHADMAASKSMVVTNIGVAGFHNMDSDTQKRSSTMQASDPAGDLYADASCPQVAPERVEIIAKEFGGLIQQLTQALLEPADAASTADANARNLKSEADVGIAAGPASHVLGTVVPGPSHASRNPTHFGTMLRVDDAAGSRKFWVELSNDVDLASHPSEMTSHLMEMPSLGAAFAIAKVSNILCIHRPQLARCD
jgi:hypothetical protein